MKYFLRLMALLMCFGALCAHATTVTSTTKIVGPDGQPFIGTLTLQLPFAGVNTSTNQLVLATPVTANIFNGIITQPLMVTGNDVMSPAMPYAALYTDLSGNPVTRQMYYITGASFDVGSAPATPNFLNTNVIAGTTLTITGNTSLNSLNVSGASTLAAVTATTISGTAITATTVNKVTLTPPATSATITVPDGTVQTFQATGTIVSRNSTDNLSNKNLQLPGSSNSITLMQACKFDNSAAVAGNGATPVTIFTCTVPAGIIQAGKCFHTRGSWQHTTGAAGVTYIFTYGSSTQSAGADAGTGVVTWDLDICNKNGVTNAQTITGIAGFDGITPIFGNVFLSGTNDTTIGQTLKFTFTVAATDQVTPLQMDTWLDQ